MYSLLHRLSLQPVSKQGYFHLIATHQERYGITATWDYFECGHGKGPCDGVGGSIKRSADQAVKQGTNIQDATDFYVWASNLKTSSISYCFVTQDKFHDTDKLVKDLMQELKPIKGTATLHAIRPPVTSLRNEIAIEWRTTSSHNSNDGWQYACLMKTALGEQQTAPMETEKVETNSIQIDQCIIAQYDRQCYVGKVKEEDSGEVHVSFMQMRGKTIYFFCLASDAR